MLQKICRKLSKFMMSGLFGACLFMYGMPIRRKGLYGFVIFLIVCMAGVFWLTDGKLEGGRLAGAHHGLCQRRGQRRHRVQARGQGLRHRSQDVHHCRAGHRVRHFGRCGLRWGALAAGRLTALSTIRLPGCKNCSFPAERMEQNIARALL